MRIYHISDLHVHHGDENNVNIQKRIDALCKIVKLEDVVVATGDISDDGRDDQYAKALDMLSSFPCQVFVLPGNHSYGPIGSGYVPERAKAFDEFSSLFQNGKFFDKYPVTLRRENVLFILLNSCLETFDPFDWACGAVGTRQLTHLKEILDSSFNQDHVKIVALHHHPFIHNDPFMKLLDADRFLRTCYGKVDIMLFGHLHEAGHWKNRVGVPLILAANSLYDSSYVREITIEGCNISVNEIFLEGCDERLWMAFHDGSFGPRLEWVRSNPKVDPGSIEGKP
jgi:3',5'-cyclic AMP phosphodiesterase CpdA